MASLPTHLTDKQISDLPWISGADETPPRIDVTGHKGKDIANFRDALYASKIPTKEAVHNGVPYIEVATDVPGARQRLDAIRLKHLSLVDENGLHVNSSLQFKSNIPLQRTDALFTDLSPSAKAGARAENPAALESLQKVFHRYGYYDNEIKDGNLKVLASGPNAQLLEEVGAIKKAPFNFEISYAPKASTLPAEMPPAPSVVSNFIKENKLSLGLGAAIITADAALAAAPAISKGNYADAASLAANSSARLATEFIMTAECTAEVASAATPLALSPQAYSGAVITGAALCATGSHEIITHGEDAISVIQARVKEVAASNGLDPDHIWASMLDKAQAATSKTQDAEPAQER